MKTSTPTNIAKGTTVKAPCRFYKSTAGILLGLATATTCSALAVKLLKKGELLALMTLMAIPVTLIWLSKADKLSDCRGR